MTDDVRATLDRLAADTLGWQGPLPDGDLSEHLDSMDRLALVVAIEDHYAIAFDAEDDAEVRTVDDVVRLVRAKRDDQAEPAADDARGGADA